MVAGSETVRDPEVVNSISVESAVKSNGPATNTASTAPIPVPDAETTTACVPARVEVTSAVYTPGVAVAEKPVTDTPVGVAADRFAACPVTGLPFASRSVTVT
jgi:hypothetical protein